MLCLAFADKVPECGWARGSGNCLTRGNPLKATWRTPLDLKLSEESSWK